MSVELDGKLVDQIVGQIKTQDDLADLSRQLLKAAVERVMAVELEDHLGFCHQHINCVSRCFSRVKRRPDDRFIK